LFRTSGVDLKVPGVNAQITVANPAGADLHWYTNRSGPRLPSAAILSVPLLVYRVAMLAWALWLALALLRWAGDR